MDEEKLVEGFTTAFPNASLDEIKKRDDQYTKVTDDVNRNLSNLARAQMVVNTETNKYLQGATRNTKYLNQIVQIGDGTIGYVTNQGVFKRFNSKADVDATLGKNGCPAGITGIKTANGSTYSKDGEYVNADVPLFVGTPMVRGQQCGYAGQNIFVGKKQGGEGDGNLIGCKKGNSSLIPTGFKMNVEAPPCPAGTFSAKVAPVDIAMILVATKWRALIWFLNMTLLKEAAQEIHPTLLMTVSPSSGSIQVVLIQRVVPSQTMPPCPTGTAPCASGNKPGYCWDPSRKMMVTTVNPNGPSMANDEKPNYMYLVKGSAFKYSESYDEHVRVSKMTSVPWNDMAGWMPDRQFTDQNYAAANKVYLQFKAAAAKMMPHLEIGESGKLTVLTAGNVISWKSQGTLTMP